MTETLKKSKKGFTLVELIVVVVILGVLMAVLVPQYIQYVERARQGVDANTLSEIVHAVEIEAALLENGVTGDITVKATGGEVTVTGTGTLADLAKNVNAVLTGGTDKEISMKSTAAQNVTGTLTINASRHVTVNLSPSIEALAAGTATAPSPAPTIKPSTT